LLVYNILYNVTHRKQGTLSDDFYVRHTICVV